MVVSSSSPTASASRSILFSSSVEEEPKGWKLSSFIDSKQCPTSTTTTTSDSTTTNTTDGIVSSFSHICDPDNILNNESIGDLRKMIEQDILNLENQVIPCKNMKNLKDDNHVDNDDNDNDAHVQIAVVIIEKVCRHDEYCILIIHSCGNTTPTKFIPSNIILLYFIMFTKKTYRWT
jgi:hypothetical protein